MASCGRRCWSLQGQGNCWACLGRDLAVWVSVYISALFLSTESLESSGLSSWVSLDWWHMPVITAEAGQLGLTANLSYAAKPCHIKKKKKKKGKYKTATRCQADGRGSRIARTLANHHKKSKRVIKSHLPGVPHPGDACSPRTSYSKLPCWMRSKLCPLPLTPTLVYPMLYVIDSKFQIF